MKHPSQEDLLGYVLGALDAQEQRDVQQLIDDNPELEEQLLEIKSALVPLDCIETSGPRPGLARRTCETVASYPLDQLAGEELPTLSRTTLSRPTAGNEDPKASLSSSEKTEGRNLFHFSGWSIPDFAVTAAALAILAGILFPTVSHVRYNSRLLACQNNLTQVGNALIRFSEMNCGCFVEIPRSGPLSASGSFAPILKDCGLIEDDNLFACAGVASDTPVHIPTVEMIVNADHDQLARFHQILCGHFGYTMGHCEDRRYCPPKNYSRSNVVLIADQPSLNGRISTNHAGCGQNCYFEDGHVAFIKGDCIGEDAIFVNDHNLVAPAFAPSTT